LLFTPHILFLGSLFGFTWPGLPSSLITVISALTSPCSLAVLFRRVTNRVMRMLSNFDDYFSWFITMLVMVTGSPPPRTSARPTRRCWHLHILSVDALLVWFPFGKLMHAFYIFPVARTQWRAARPQRSHLMSEAAVMPGANLAPAEARTPEARVAGAMSGFAQEIGALSAFRLESCIHCGICADACHFYIATEDPQYTPIWKVEPFKQAYKREASAFAPLYRLLGLKREVTADQLAQWQHLLFDSCNMCGRCSLICPMGIDVAALIEQARHAMFDAGLAPKELYEKAAHQRAHRPAGGERGTLPRAAARDRQAIQGRHAARQARGGRHAVRAEDRYRALPECRRRTGAKVMQHLGVSCTFRSDALVAENYGYYAGGKQWQREISLRLIDQAIACKAKILLVPECGHAYAALRWEAADLYGKPLPFKVLQVTEFLAESSQAGRLRLAAAGRRDHLPRSVRVGAQGRRQRCAARTHEGHGRRLARNGRITAVSVFCCGGGGGVLDIERAAPLRYRTMENKLREIDDTGADHLLTSCSDCRRTFDDAQAHFAGTRSRRACWSSWPPT
jgi:Fe-S oxidoreductase